MQTPPRKSKKPIGQSLIEVQKSIVGKKNVSDSSVLLSTKKVTFANEAIYKIYSEIAGILWGAALVVVFYFEAMPWQKAVISTVLIFGALTCITGLLIRKGTLDEDEDRVSLSRPWSLILCEFSWKIFSLGVVALMPALAWDVFAYGSSRKVADNPALLPVLIVHILVIAGCIFWMHRLARKERVQVFNINGW